jgi:hypothetical protein
VSASLFFVLDTSALIQAARTYYAFDIAPSFWPQLVNLAIEGNIVSIDKVKREILKGSDDLAAWSSSEFSNAFASTQDQDVFIQYQELILWSQTHSHYNQTAKVEFAGTDIADPWVIAFAKAKRGVVVSAEEYKIDIKRKILIPNACQELGVPYANTVDMLRTLKVRL